MESGEVTNRKQGRRPILRPRLDAAADGKCHMRLQEKLKKHKYRCYCIQRPGLLNLPHHLKAGTFLQVEQEAVFNHPLALLMHHVFVVTNGRQCGDGAE